MSVSLWEKLDRMWNMDWSGEVHQLVEFISPIEIMQEYENETGQNGQYQRSSPESIKNFTRSISEHANRLDGQVATVVKKFESEQKSSEFVKEKAKQLGADISGIARFSKSWLYKGQICAHPFAVSLGMKMDPLRMKNVPYSANYESMRIYLKMGEATVKLAEEIRALGYSARAHHPFSIKGVQASQVMHIPIARDAGLGKLGRHGSLISPVLGSWFRLSTITTDLPLVPDEPLGDEITSFCRLCNLCARHCPGQAISYEKRFFRTELKGGLWCRKNVCHTGMIWAAAQYASKSVQ